MLRLFHRILLALLLFLILATPLSASVIHYDEMVTGDLQELGLPPIFDLDIGLKTVRGMTGPEPPSSILLASVWWACWETGDCGEDSLPF